MRAHTSGEATMKVAFVPLLSLVLFGCVSTSLTNYNDKVRAEILIDSQQLLAELPNSKTPYNPSLSKKYYCAYIENSCYCKSH